MMISDGYDDIATHNFSASKVLTQYKNEYNPEVKLLSVDLRGYAKTLNLSDEFTKRNHVRIFGMSDSILKYITLKERSQIEDIEEFAKTV